MCFINMKKYNFTILFILALIISGCASTVIMPWNTVPDVPELVDTYLYRGPRPNFEELKKHNIKVIISLENDKDIVEEEALQFHKIGGIKVVNFPMNDSNTPRPSSIQLLGISYIILENAQLHRNVYVHCRRGIDRTGYAIAAYRILVNKWSPEKAYSEVLNNGHAAWYFPDWITSLEEIAAMYPIE
jgi:protein-tyrosine phosphatase